MKSALRKIVCRTPLNAAKKRNLHSLQSFDHQNPLTTEGILFNLLEM